MHMYRGTTLWLCICGLREGTENSQVKSWSHQALDWKGPADTSITLTLSCRPLIYQEKEEAAESRTFIAGSIPTPAASTSQTTDQQPVRSVGSKITGTVTTGTVTESKFDITLQKHWFSIKSSSLSE